MIPFEFVSIFTGLHLPETRMVAARELAAFAKAADVLVFGKDEEIGVFLPAPGLPQTLRQGGRWQSFLNECAKAGIATGMVPASHDDTDIAAVGLTDNRGLSILVFLGAELGAKEKQWILALLPLLGAKLAVERAALTADGHAAAARDASQRAGALNTALDGSRRELQKAYERAERELVFRREAERKLKEANRQKDDFLAMLAHELRNPLAPIGAAADLLSIARLDAARVRQASEVISRQVGHMTSLIDDLLDVSRVTRGLIALNMDAIDVKGVVADAVEQVRRLMETRRHRLALHLPPESPIVSGDKKRLVQVLANLLSNAAKYTPDGGDIVVRIDVEAGRLSLTVIDNGIGMAPELVERVFELFAQAERSSDRSQGGLGVGLALVRRLVELHGGTVTAHSDGAGAGSRFSVFLPRLDQAPELPAARRDSLAMASSTASLRVMIVDDNADAADMLSMFLEAAGHTVYIEHRARTALDRARTVQPDVCLLDIGLPDMDGNALAQQLRALPGMSNAVLVAVTGYGQPQDRENAFSAGFHHHFVKPVEMKKLACLLTHIVPGGA
jgi:signal transduction histidine kinase/ActR/RegA family two-component response regulator